jgi:hypothetical protein
MVLVARFGKGSGNVGGHESAMKRAYCLGEA